MNYNTENVRIAIDNYAYDTYFNEEWFLAHILADLSLELSNRILTILDSQENVIMKKPNVATQNNYKTCQVVFTESVEWMPLVRCKDCKRAIYDEPGMVYCPNIVGGWCNEDWFCASGERRKEDNK